jgi:hypothetical protein
MYAYVDLGKESNVVSFDEETGEITLKLPTGGLIALAQNASA